ncbi:hypothetical protein LH29_22575 [Draconibacterium sediminis]|uniref:Uncharacterized protein n=1 Tax=Draconibacterium sediminis TaxID=1544798 RepID=A0A0D8J526_9BACT|nr:hypothetical protein LH29_22575 [Draconibacterium sediminis]
MFYKKSVIFKELKPKLPNTLNPTLAKIKTKIGPLFNVNTNIIKVLQQCRLNNMYVALQHTRTLPTI